jgi:hypothetical protein
MSTIACAIEVVAERVSQHRCVRTRLAFQNRSGWRMLEQDHSFEMAPVASRKARTSSSIERH